jgi:alpha-amylase
MTRPSAGGIAAFRAALALVCAVLSVCAGASVTACGGTNSYSPGGPLTLDVSAAFPAGTVVRDQYSGASATVGASGSVTITPDANGVVLLEKDGSTATPFTWPGATVYFVMTDRFLNGDASNDNSYGRARDGAGEIGTWHGGDLKGLTAKLDYIAGLGASAIWISPPVEQVHGWVSGNAGEYRSYGYHGYWALDFTRLDANFGTEAEMQAFVDGAHSRGIRVLFDVVLNHPGYATGADLVSYLPEVFVDGTGAAFQAFTPNTSRRYDAWNDLVNYGSSNWVNWWSPSWIRAGFPGFDPGGTDDLTSQLSSLPDFKTESSGVAGLPVLFTRKPDTAAVEIQGDTVRQYLVKWQTDWVRRFGIDGFRCDTAKNVELASWSALKTAGLSALSAWKADAANAGRKLPDDSGSAPFWMTGEVYGHGVAKDGYYTEGGFDSLINFNFQTQLVTVLHNQSLVAGAVALDGMYSTIAALVSTDPTFDVLSYLSSHDTDLFFGYVGLDPARMRQAGTALLLAPGGAQVFYGDESGRKPGTSDDRTQNARSDMNWDTADATILAHWQKLGLFRKKHAAIGGGAHKLIPSPAGTYAFSRKLNSGGIADAVVIALTN